MIEGSREVIDLKFGFGDPLFLHHLEDTADKLGKTREGWEEGTFFLAREQAVHFGGLAKRSACETSREISQWKANSQTKFFPISSR